MPVSNPITLFGFHQATIRDRQTQELFPLIIAQAYAPNFSEEIIPLQGGANPFPWDTATGYAEGTLSLTVAQYDLAILRFFGGDNAASYTENTSGETAGFASALTNKVGTSVFKSTTGIASVSVKSGGNPKFGNYVVRAASASTVHVYLDNPLDGATEYDDNARITQTPISITSGGTVEIPGVDLEFTGGSGTIALTTGDVAVFHARPQNSYNFEYNLGAGSKPEFGLSIYTERLGTNKYRAWEFPRVKANGISPSGEAKQWSTFESEATILYDAAAKSAGKLIVVNR